MYVNLAGYYCNVHTPEDIQILFNSNLILPAYVIDAAIKARCKYIIHTSSYQQCYHGESYNPTGFYAATKQAFEDIIYYYSSLKKITVITLQLFDTYGADDKRNKIFNLVRRMQDGDSMDMSPGMQKLYFCYIDDVIEAYMVAIQMIREQNPGFNKKYSIRENEPIELKKFLQRYIEVTKREIYLKWGNREYKEKEIMDPTGFGEILPQWYPKISYEQGIKICGDYDLKV